MHKQGDLATRVRLRGRFLLSDMDLIERHVPDGGSIVDIGCGHGIFSNLLALRRPGRNILGVDVDSEKIRHARTTLNGRPNIDFIAANTFDFPLPECDAITIVDMTYLLPKDKQLKLLEICKRSLRPGGKLIWKTQERRRHWKYAFMHAQEMAGLFSGMTPSGQKSFFFLSRSEAIESMKRAGFESRVVEMPTRLPYCEVLYVGS